MIVRLQQAALATTDVRGPLGSVDGFVFGVATTTTGPRGCDAS